MSNDIHRILEKLSLLESNITTAFPKGSQNKQQKEVPQLPALFNPKKISPVLGSKKDPEHPMRKYMVGDDVEVGQSPLAEEMKTVEEDMLNKVKKDLTAYLDQLTDKSKLDRELVSKAKKEIEQDDPTEEGVGGGLIGAVGGAALTKTASGAATGYKLGSAVQDAIDEDPTEQAPEADYVPADTINPTLPEEAPVKTVTFEDGSTCDIFGDQRRGFEIRRGNRRLPTRFKNLDHAQMATDMYRAQRAASTRDLGQDYVDEQ